MLGRWNGEKATEGVGGILDGRESQKGDFGFCFVFFLLHPFFSPFLLFLYCVYLKLVLKVAEKLETQHKALFAESLNNLIQLSSFIISEYFLSVLQKVDTLLCNIST